MCYYQKEFKIKLSSNSSAHDFHFHVIFMSGYENYQTLSPSSLIPLFTSGLPVSVHGVWVLPLVKTSQRDGLGLEWVGQSPSSLSLSQPGTPMGHQEVSVFRVLISNNEIAGTAPGLICSSDSLTYQELRIFFTLTSIMCQTLNITSFMVTK